MLDAIAQHVDPSRARTVLRASLKGTPVPPPGDTDADEISDFLHEHVSPSLARVIGTEESKEVLRTADALVAPLRKDRIANEVRTFRAPYVLVSDRVNALEKVVDLRRVETMIDAAIELDGVPDATLVIDARTTATSLVTLALAAEDLPAATQILVVGATDEARAMFEDITHRAATFVDRFIPLDLRASEPTRRAA